MKKMIKEGLGTGENAACRKCIKEISIKICVSSTQIGV